MELKLEQQFKKGALEMVLLSLIARQRSYGYELISRLQREGGGLFQETKEGTLYPILYRLEDEGLIESELAVSYTHLDVYKRQGLQRRFPHPPGHAPNRRRQHLGHFHGGTEYPPF